MTRKITAPWFCAAGAVLGVGLGGVAGWSPAHTTEYAGQGTVSNARFSGLQPVNYDGTDASVRDDNVELSIYNYDVTHRYRFEDYLANKEDNSISANPVSSVEFDYDSDIHFTSRSSDPNSAVAMGFGTDWIKFNGDTKSSMVVTAFPKFSYKAPNLAGTYSNLVAVYDETDGRYLSGGPLKASVTSVSLWQGTVNYLIFGLLGSLCGALAWLLTEAISKARFKKYSFIPLTSIFSTEKIISRTKNRHSGKGTRQLVQAEYNAIQDWKYLNVILPKSYGEDVSAIESSPEYEMVDASLVRLNEFLNTSDKELSVGDFREASRLSGKAIKLLDEVKAQGTVHEVLS